jgi:hypothetical protein
VVHSACPYCRVPCPVLEDGTLADHAQNPDQRQVGYALLCPGSRSAAGQSPADFARARERRAMELRRRYGIGPRR